MNESYAGISIVLQLNISDSCLLKSDMIGQNYSYCAALAGFIYLMHDYIWHRIYIFGAGFIYLVQDLC